ncbi:HEXXH motif domain-containing protein [Kibdelosporangium phytohabitans]|nr:HEXXH motif domain-containing protein [Kibdelosporangium phytohabitans]MBE1464409.1 HEXXH motif-containing protein [Kibdelosporangium phytohabitans]
MGLLTRSVHSQRKAMLLAVMRELPARGHSADVLADVERSWAVLSAAERARPDVVDDVLMHPATGVWLVRTLRSLLGPDGDAGSELWYLRAIAAAAAIRTGVPFTMVLPFVRGVVCLPTVGVISQPPGATSQFVEMHTSAGCAVLRLDSETGATRFEDSDDFLPVQQHRVSASGIDLVVEIDDTNPYREFADPIPPRRMSAAQRTRWQHLLDDAWELLVDRHPGYARELAAGLRTIAPILDDRRMVGSSSNAAFGAVALSSKVSATALAEALVHELQHSKLNALLELVTLRVGDAGQRWYAPWRDDPRPLSGLLHGLYAFASVVEFWRLQRDQAGTAAYRREADYVFAHRRHQLRQAISAIESTPDLTEPGSRLVAEVSRRVARCAEASVPAEVTETVALIERDHRVTWRLRHVRPDSGYVDRLTTAWLHQRPAPPPVAASDGEVVPFLRSTTASARTSLLKTKITDPDRFRELLAQPSHGVSEGDVAFATGDLRQATAAYVDKILHGPTDVSAWAGLTVSMAARSPEGHALRTMPEVVFDLYNRLLDMDGSTDPVGLAGWLGAALPA